MRYNDEIFDALLTDACAEVRREGLAALDALAPETCAAPALAAAPAPGRRRPRRLAALAAAALCLALATGVCAAWPQLRTELRAGRGWLLTDGAPPQAPMSPMVFGPMPAGYELAWTDADARDGVCSAVISYRAGATTRSGRAITVERGFTVTQIALAEEMAAYTDAEGGPLTEEAWQEIQDSYLTLDSISEVTADDLHSRKILRWTDGTCLYTFRWNGAEEFYQGSALCYDAPDYRNEARYAEIIGILQAIHA